MRLNKESATLIQSHLLATTGREWPIDTITARPYYKQIWESWKALAYYKINDNYERLEDAPNGIGSINVMTDTRKLYMWRKGKYAFIQETTEKECKSFYGE
jgi:hypothetical protein